MSRDRSSLQHHQTMLLSPRSLSISLLGLWLLCSNVTSQEICSSPGTLPAPRLFLDKLSARHGDMAMLSCLVPLDAPMTRIVFCKDGKEISVQPKGGNKLIYDSPYEVSRESAGAFSCRYQLKDDNNQENNSLSSDPWYLHVNDGDGSEDRASPQDGDGSREGTLLQGPGISGWIFHSTLVLLLLVSALIITCILRKRALTQPIQKALGLGGRDEEEGEVAEESGGSRCSGQVGGSAEITDRSADYAIVQKCVHGTQGD